MQPIDRTRVEIIANGWRLLFAGGVDCAEIEAHGLEQLEVQLSACVVAEVNLSGIGRNPP